MKSTIIYSCIIAGYDYLLINKKNIAFAADNNLIKNLYIQRKLTPIIFQISEFQVNRG